MKTQLADADQRYNFICPNCSGSFSIQLDRIPPVQARFRCPHCKQPMDFPSRDEARQQIQLQAEGGGGASPAPAKAPASNAKGDTPPSFAAVAETTASGNEGGGRFRIEKPGFQTDVFDRRGIRNLIRTFEVVETDRIRVDDAEAVPAADLPYLKSLFKMAKEQRTRPATCCRTHPDKVAFFRCHDSGRPLCEQCAPEKKFGGQNLRVCQHCGGTAEDFLSA